MRAATALSATMPSRAASAGRGAGGQGQAQGSKVSVGRSGFMCVYKGSRLCVREATSSVQLLRQSNGIGATDDERLGGKPSRQCSATCQRPTFFRHPPLCHYSLSAMSYFSLRPSIRS